jgi:acetyl esterase/lipase
VARSGYVPAVTTHAYGDHPHQFAELTLPDGDPAGPLPVAVLVHGGFWRAEYGLGQMEPLAADLARRGGAAWNVEYRRLGAGSRGGWPQTPQDVSAAIDHLAALDAGVALDLARVVSVGHSAGGHLALLDAARGDAAGVRVDAVVGLAPLTDVGHAHALGGEGVAVVEAFMGGGPVERAAEYAAASPVARVPLGLPQRIVQGDRDELVPPAMVAAYVAAARDAGDEVTFDQRPDDGHFELIEPDGAGWAAVVDWLQARFA